ncbi:BppU family phage baseplate upper protein [Bacillus mycoides]|uniref:BppU family phage baseplate upper protein n=1 Tax=Bacillus mycoides TaxID=1405 RepID=UPI001F08DF84|nr:BppU family phage baseplate upper protein [Bacillus mycoides]
MKTKLILDVNKTQHAQLNSIVTGRVGDKASNTVDIYVVDGFVPYNLTGSDVYFECAKPDNTSVRDKNGITMIDAAKGHFEYTFPTQTFAAVGKSKQAYFTVEKNSTVKATTQDFIIVSLPDALTNRIPSKTYISQLEELIWQLGQIELDLLNSEAYKEAHDAKEFAEQAKMISESVQEQLNQIVINGSIDPETKQTRVDEKGIAYNTLKERIGAEQNKIGDLSVLGTQPRNLAISLSERGLNVKDFGVKGDYNKTTGVGTDDTIALNKVLDVFRGNEIRVPKGVYLISSDLIIYSNTTLVLHSEAEIFVKNGTGTGGNPNAYLGKHMIKNHNTDGLNNIRITGGIWNGNGINQVEDSMRGFWLNNVNGLTLEKIKITEVNGWGMSISNPSKFLVRDIEFDQIEGQAANGDGVHVSGGSDGTIENIYGFTSDDLVVLDAGDILFEKASIDNIIIKNIRPKKKGQVDAYKAVALYATGGYKIDNVIIDGVIGNTYASMIILANPRSQEGVGYFGKITISNVIGNTVSERQPINIEKYIDTVGDNSKKIVIDSLIIYGYQRKKMSTDIDKQPIISVKNADIKNLTITNFEDEYDGKSGQLLNSNYSSINNLSLNGYRRSQKTQDLDSDPLFFLKNTNIYSFNISNVSDTVLSNGSPIAVVDVSCIIENFKVTDLNRKIIKGGMTPFASLLFIHETSEVTDIEINNINIVFNDANGVGLIYQYGKSSQIFMSNIKCYSKSLPNPINIYTKNNTIDTTSVTLLKFSNVYSGKYYAGYTNINIVSGKVRATGIDIVADITKITDPQNSDLVTNKNGGLSKYNGTAWLSI